MVFSCRVCVYDRGAMVCHEHMALHMLWLLVTVEMEVDPYDRPQPLRLPCPVPRCVRVLVFPFSFDPLLTGR